jgi:hypothetical protein
MRTSNEQKAADSDSAYLLHIYTIFKTITLGGMKAWSVVREAACAVSIALSIDPGEDASLSSFCRMLGEPAEQHNSFIVLLIKANPLSEITRYSSSRRAFNM